MESFIFSSFLLNYIFNAIIFACEFIFIHEAGETNMNKLIYYIEDDADIAFGVKEYLSKKELTVTVIGTLTEAEKLLNEKLPDLLLMDWNLPDGSGAAFCSNVREKWKGVPIIFLTVRGDTKDIVKGFQYGADDYLVKPFELEVLYSRICAVLRRAGDVNDNFIICDSIVLDKEKVKVLVGKVEINLSSIEYQLLCILMENKNHTVTRQRLLEMIWDANGNFVNDNTLTVTMKRLREKLHQPVCIKTIRSFGYRMEG